MKVVILAGGLGTRLAEETDRMPKPMVEIGGRPIIWHIMRNYAKHGLHEFIICLGYKGHMIKQYFINYLNAHSDFTLDLATGELANLGKPTEDWKITFIDTGEKTQTGGRLKAIGKYLPKGDPFCLTYGDGVGDVDITASIEFHQKHGKLATVTAVTPPGRFGVLDINDETVKGFQEKPTEPRYRINAGFFILQPDVLEYIDGPQTSWENNPMREIASAGQMKAFLHDGFWMPMDTVRDRNELNRLWSLGNAPWKTW